MSFAAFASALLLAVLTSPQAAAPASPDLRDLRWIRGTVIATGPQAVTLRLRDRDITLLHDGNTEFVATDRTAAVAIGATVEAHYTDRKGVRRAVLLIGGLAPGHVSKRPSTSVRGNMPRLSHGALSVTSGGKTRRSLAFERKSQLVDRDGRLLAIGKSEILKALPPDAEVVVKYNTEGGVIVEGVDLGGNDNIVEIRLLR
jgi:hypothetical protein